jgi:hypothetical protein
MISKTFLRTTFWVALTAIAAGLTTLDLEAFAADAAATSKTVKKTKAPRGVLPPYYSKVVTEEQREKIYSIQALYRPKIEEARTQLNALIEEQKNKISAVLSDTQKKQVEDAQSAALLKRAAKKTLTQKVENDPLVEMQDVPKTNK